MSAAGLTQQQTIRKTVFGFSTEDFCLPGRPDPPGIPPGLVRADFKKTPAGRICHLFTISNTRPALPTPRESSLTFPDCDHPRPLGQAA
jgi:hypothetical protein